MNNYQKDKYSVNKDVEDPSLRSFLKKLSATIGIVSFSSIILPGCEESSSYDYGLNDPNVVLALGDSITVAGYPEMLEEMITKDVINAGHCGETSKGGARRVENLLNTNNPGYLLLMYGTNDVHYGIKPENFRKNIKYIIETAKSKKTIPIIGTAIPRPDRNDRLLNLNEIVKDVASEEKIKFADTYSAFGEYNSELYRDAVHPNEKGSRIIAECFSKKIWNL